MLRQHAVEHVVDLVAGMQIGGIVGTAGPQLPRADGEFVGAEIEVVQVAEMGPLRGIDEMTDQVPLDVRRLLFIRGERVVSENIDSVCHGIILSEEKLLMR